MTVVEELVKGGAAEVVRGDLPGGPSTSQTIMVASLETLFEALPPNASADAYRSAVMEENALGKRTTGAREWAFRQLRRFYSLDPTSLLFRALRDLWPENEGCQPLLATLCAMARDPVFRASAPMIIRTEVGTPIGPEDFEKVIEDSFPGAYRATTRRTTARNLASSWSQAGHLAAETRTHKLRTHVTAAPSTLAYALLLGYLQGARGGALFETRWAKVLDQPKSGLLDLGVAASQRGLLELRHAGGVVEVSFHELLRPFPDGEQAPP